MPTGSFGDETGKAVLVRTGEARLHAGAGAFLTNENAYFGPTAQVERTGDLTDPDIGPSPASRIIGRDPNIFGQDQNGVLQFTAKARG